MKSSRNLERSIYYRVSGEPSNYYFDRENIFPITFTLFSIFINLRPVFAFIFIIDLENDSCAFYLANNKCFDSRFTAPRYGYPNNLLLYASLTYTFKCFTSKFYYSGSEFLLVFDGEKNSGFLDGECP
jgi:hypothetical protein